MDKKKEIDKNLKLIVKSSFIVFIGIFLSKIFTYIYRIIIARYFGPEVYGLFSLAVMITSFLVVFSALGLSAGLVRYISLYRGKNEYEKIRHIFRVSIRTSLISSLIAALILFFLADFISIKIFHNIELINFLKMFSILIPLWVFSEIFLSVIRAFEKISWYSFIFNILQNIVKVIAVVFFIFLGFKVNAIIFSYILGFLSMAVVSYLVCRYKIAEIFGKNNLKKQIKTKINKDFLSYSLPLLFSAFVITILYGVDSFLIGYFENASEVGIYNVAIVIASLMGVFPGLFVQLFFPLITKEFSKGNNKIIKELSQQVAKWIFILNLPIFLIIFLFPGAIINILFGSDYLFAENALRILIVGSFSWYSIFISYHLLLMAGKSKLILMNFSIALIANVLLNILLIPRYGLVGAAFSTTIVRIILSATFFLQVKHYLSIIPFRKKIIKISLVMIFPLLLIIYLKEIIQINFISLILIGFLFLFLYILLIFVTGCLDEYDFKIMGSIKEKIKTLHKIQ